MIHSAYPSWADEDLTPNPQHGDGDMPDFEAMTKSQFRVLENRLRRVAQRRGYLLWKSRRRDPKALDYGLYALFDPQADDSKGDIVNPPHDVLGTPFSMCIGCVWRFLMGDDQPVTPQTTH